MRAPCGVKFLGNKSAGRIEGAGGAAELLDMNPSTLRAKMRKLGIKIKRTAA
jgi:transcriptional regulator with GAF, ATPase, and Fis domain